MNLSKKKFFVLTIFLFMLIFTSFYIFKNKLKTNKYTKAKLVIEYSSDHNYVRM